MMQFSANGQRLVEQFEGREHKAYLDGGGVPTIGVGHTRGVRMGDTATDEQIDAWFADDVRSAVAAVNKAVPGVVSQNQFDAMVSLAFNIGNSAFAQSTLVRKLNAGDGVGAANEFPRWDKDNGKVVPGLSRRRRAERLLFITP